MHINFVRAMNHALKSQKNFCKFWSSELLDIIEFCFLGIIPAAHSDGDWSPGTVKGERFRCN